MAAVTRLGPGGYPMVGVAIASWQLYVSKNSGAYQPVTTTSTMGVKSVDAGSDADETTITVPRLTPP